MMGDLLAWVLAPQSPITSAAVLCLVHPAVPQVSLLTLNLLLPHCTPQSLFSPLPSTFFLSAFPYLPPFCLLTLQGEPAR